MILISLFGLSWPENEQQLQHFVKKICYIWRNVGTFAHIPPNIEVYARK
jgi:hypothetical protein